MADPSSPDPAAALPLLQRRGSPQLQQLECSSADGASLLATASTSQQTCPDPALILPPPPQLQPTERSSSEEEELMLASALTRALSDLSVNVPSVPASPQTFRDCEGSGPCTPTAKTPQSRSSFTGKIIFGSSRGSSAATSPNTSLAAPSPSVVCSICLEPVKLRPRMRGGGNLTPFQTPCCHQFFHKACLKRHKEHCASPSNPRACPLCRSQQPTGLTPSQGSPRIARGFVSGLSLHTEMMRRVATARNAVARSLAAQRSAQEAPSHAGSDPQPQPHRSLSASPRSSVFFTSPGAAYEAVSRNQFQARLRRGEEEEQ